MKNIKEIMSEMTGLSKQIAVTLNNEEVESDKGITPVSTPECCNPSTNTECATEIDSTVDFCCAMNFPANFVPLQASLRNPRILYDVSSLKCIIEECCCGGCIHHDIRIVGCIPFIINVRVDSTDMCPVNGPNVFACCSGTACVDNVVCSACTYKDAVLACNTISQKLTCTGITVDLMANTIDNCGIVEISGCFHLPPCED